MSTLATVLSRRRWYNEHAGPTTCPPNTGLVPTLVCRHYKWVPGYKCAGECPGARRLEPARLGSAPSDGECVHAPCCFA